MEKSTESILAKPLVPEPEVPVNNSKLPELPEPEAEPEATVIFPVLPFTAEPERIATLADPLAPVLLLDLTNIVKSANRFTGPASVVVFDSDCRG